MVFYRTVILYVVSWKRNLLVFRLLRDGSRHKKGKQKAQIKETCYCNSYKGEFLALRGEHITFGDEENGSLNRHTATEGDTSLRGG